MNRLQPMPDPPFRVEWGFVRGFKRGPSDGAGKEQERRTRGSAVSSSRKDRWYVSLSETGWSINLPTGSRGSVPALQSPENGVAEPGTVDSHSARGVL